MEQPCTTCPTYLIFTRNKCRWCEDLHPVLEQLKTRQGHHKYHVSIIERSAYPNLVEQFEVGGYPTILLWIPAQDRNVGFYLQRYQGDRSLPDMEKFVLNRKYVEAEPYPLSEATTQLLRKRIHEYYAQTSSMR